MKETFLNLLAAMFVLGTIISFCFSVDRRDEFVSTIVHDAKEDFKEGRLFVSVEKPDVVNNFMYSRNISIEEISYNEKLIAELKNDIKNKKIDQSEDGTALIDVLEKRNHILKDANEANQDDSKIIWHETDLRGVLPN